MAWNWDSSLAWARSLGMISVPLFGPARAATYPGKHAIMLDGEKASFALSFYTSNDAPQKPLDWAWSSNVLWSVLVDITSKSLWFQRWDKPTDQHEQSATKESEVFDLIEMFDHSSLADEITVIDRALKVFREVRTAVADVGGSDDDTMLVFLSLLDWHKKSVIEDKSYSNVPDTWDSLIANVPAVTAKGKTKISASQMDYPLGELGELLISGQDENGYQLDSDLLLRHASGVVFQEAHRQLISHPLQKKLFPTGAIAPSVTKGVLKKDAIYTPPALARLLVEKAIDALDVDEKSRTLEILNPACGSGVFLIEAYRDAHAREIQNLHLRGMDSSHISCDLAMYSVRSTIGDSIDNNVTLSVLPVDSLDEKSWGQPDVIATNPPFVSWEHMDDDEQQEVRHILGQLYFGRPDKSAAFVVKALRSLKPGAVLATLIPESFLTSRYSHRIRKWIIEDDSFQVVFMGQFTGFEYFRSAVVEPAFLIICRSKQHNHKLTQQLSAPDHLAARAIRSLRLVRNQRGRRLLQKSPDITILETELSEGRWKAERASVTTLHKQLERLDIPRIGQLFWVQAGIRTGNNSVFVVKSWQLKDWGIPEKWRFVFRPDASNTTIRSGKLVPSRYIFYPYDENGNDVFHSEAELAECLGGFYSERLKPNQKAL